VLYHGTGTKLYGTAATPWGTVVPVHDVGELKAEIKVEGLDEFTAAVKSAKESVEEYGKSLASLAHDGAMANDALKGLGDVLKKFDAAFGFEGESEPAPIVLTMEQAKNPLIYRAAMREAEKAGVRLQIVRVEDAPEPATAAPASQPPTRKRRIRLPEEP
jgi:hypothetical protein